MITEESPTVPDYPPSERKRRWPKRLAVGAAVAVPVIAIGAFVALAFGLSGSSLSRDSSALAAVNLDSFGGEVERVVVTTGDGTEVPAKLTDGRIVPEGNLHPGEPLTVKVTVKRPSMTGWLVGSTATQTLHLKAPTAHVKSRWISVKKGGSPKVHFSQPVRAVAYGQPGELVHRQFSHPHHAVSLGEQATAGSVVVAAAARSWEKPGKFKQVTWFPASGSPTLAANPVAGSEVSPSTPLKLTFSKKVSKVLGGQTPELDPAVPGKWKQADPHTLVFIPTGFGAPMATDVEAKLPKEVAVVQGDGSVAETDKVAWHVPGGTTLRLQQLLAQAGYLPVDWKPSSGEAVKKTPEGEVRATTEPPHGHFEWRYHDTPGSLKEQWKPGEEGVITQGALMAFQRDHELETDGVAGPEVWEKLMESAIAGDRSKYGYDYIYVTETLPETVFVWHNGKVVFEGAGNTGIPGAETELGTFPVFEHLEETTMSGENPDGSKYVDPGIMYVSYFNGGDALHAFDRGSYGTPQSLGCVEMPLEEAQTVYPYSEVGTIVHIEA